MRNHLRSMGSLCMSCTNDNVVLLAKLNRRALKAGLGLYRSVLSKEGDMISPVVQCLVVAPEDLFSLHTLHLLSHNRLISLIGFAY